MSCFRSCVCCPCNSVNAIMDILSKDTTQEFALAVIIGEAFYELIQKFTTSTVTPTMRAMFTDPSRWMVETVSGGILLTKGARYDNLPDNATVRLSRLRTARSSMPAADFACAPLTV
jgi:hypothetical protein